MAGTISPDEVRRIARLARLTLTEAEVGVLARQLGDILAHFARLSTVDTEGVEPTSHAAPLDCPARPDEPAPSLPHDEALANAPRTEDGAFVVPKIVG